MLIAFAVGARDTDPTEVNRVTFLPSLKVAPIPKDCML